MVNQLVYTLAVAILVPAAIVAGCAKRTVTADIAPPPPAARAPERPGAATVPEGPVAPLAEITTRPGTAPPSAATGAPTGAAEALAPIGPARPSVAEFAARAELEDIHFDFDRYDIRPGDARILDGSAAWLRTNPGALVLIEGHCDERGTDAYNLALGDRRAKAAMDYLVSRGVQSDRITTVSYGEERPLCREHTEACWAKNRRAHFLVKAP
jgi:peptidoglycan-associated lipoprotein